MSQSEVVQQADIIEIVAASSMAAGQIHFLGDLAGQVVADVDAGRSVGVRVEGAIKLSKEAGAGVIIALGTDAHWDATNERAVDVAADGVLGKAIAGGADADDYVVVKLNS